MATARQPKAKNTFRMVFLIFLWCGGSGCRFVARAWCGWFPAAVFPVPVHTNGFPTAKLVKSLFPTAFCRLEKVLFFSGKQEDFVSLRFLFAFLKGRMVCCRFFTKSGHKSRKPSCPVRSAVWRGCGFRNLCPDGEGSRVPVASGRRFPLGYAPKVLSSACRRSAMMSSTSSIPTERRMRSGATPASRSCSSESWRWVWLAG